MEHRPNLYVGAAFAAGVLVCSAFKDLYPDLQRRYERRFGRKYTTNKTLAGAGLSDDQNIGLVDHTGAGSSLEPVLPIPEGMESCIGNTPLIKVKSLSEWTGCEILAKAEVHKIRVGLVHPRRSNAQQVSEWRWWQPQRPSSS